MQKENISIKGIVELSLYDSSTNELKYNEVVNNLVTTNGKNFIAKKIIDEDDSVTVKSIKIGDDSTAANVSDTDVVSELAEADIRFSFVDNTNTNTVNFTTTFEEGVGTGTIREIGLFDSQSVLLCRTVTSSPFTKTSTDYLVVTWKLQIG